MEYTTLATDQYNFSYWDSEAKDKPVYVLFHGFGSSTHFQWFKQAKLLSKTHRLILPNLLHFGSEPKGGGKHSVQEQATAIAVLLEELKIDKMVLGGISYGGLVAAELAMLEQDKIEKLTIFASPVKFFSDEDMAKVERDNDVDDITELLVPADIETMRKMTDIVLYKDRKIPKFILKDLHKNMYLDEQNNANYKAVLNAMQADKEELRSRNYQFDFPVLLVWGANDELVPARIGTELKEFLPSAELHLIPEAGHGVNVEQKKKFDKILLEFLKK